MPTKERISAAIDPENVVFLKWLKLNFGDGFSYTINMLLTQYREQATANMTPYELEQIQKLSVVPDGGAIDRQGFKSLRNVLLMGRADEALRSPAKRKALQALLDIYSQEKSEHYV